MILNDVECETLNLFVMQVSRNLFLFLFTKCFIKHCLRPKALAKLQRNVASNIICFCFNEAKRLCLNHCSWLLDDAE